MITFKQASNKAGYNQTLKCPIKLKSTWFAYKDGTCQEFTTESEAKAFSNLVENKTINKIEFDTWWNEQNSLHHDAHSIWYDALKTEYNDISNEIFNLCYSEACERCDSYGHDEVANCMHDIIYFATKIRNAT